MRLISFLIVFAVTSVVACHSQSNSSSPTGMNKAASKFLETLSNKQKAKTQFQFDVEERFNWHFVPKDRNGIALKELNEAQHKGAMDLLQTALSDTGFAKTNAIIQLETVLRDVENRSANDDVRDPGKFYLSIFGNPAVDSIWGWRFEGHHISFNFSSKDNRLVSATPGFLGANPAVVLFGPEKGKQILKDETMLGFELFNSLDPKQKEKALINNRAPADIVTGASRNANIDAPQGIFYHELNDSQQKIFMQLLGIYIHRYTRLFARDMMNEITAAGLNKLQFAWAGAQKTGIGNPHYYRIQGPTIIIEYDNTQNNANHIHTVIRDLKNDFGGDQLLEHYKRSRH